MCVVHSLVNWLGVTTMRCSTEIESGVKRVSGGVRVLTDWTHRQASGHTLCVLLRQFLPTLVCTSPPPPPHTLTFHQVAEEVESQLQKYKAAVDEINAKTGGEHDTDTNGEGGYWGGGLVGCGSVGAGGVGVRTAGVGCGVGGGGAQGVAACFMRSGWHRKGLGRGGEAGGDQMPPAQADWGQTYPLSCLSRAVLCCAVPVCVCSCRCD